MFLIEWFKIIGKIIGILQPIFIYRWTLSILYFISFIQNHLYIYFMQNHKANSKVTNFEVRHSNFTIILLFINFKILWNFLKFSSWSFIDALCFFMEIAFSESGNAIQSRCPACNYFVTTYRSSLQGRLCYCVIRCTQPNYFQILVLYIILFALNYFFLHKWLYYIIPSMCLLAKNLSDSSLF